MKKQWTAAALADLDHIYAYYQEYSEQGAKNVIRDILDRVDSLNYPHQYQVYDVLPAYRRMVVRDYLILYKVHEDVVVIYKVISGKQKPSEFLTVTS